MSAKNLSLWIRQNPNIPVSGPDHSFSGREIVFSRIGESRTFTRAKSWAENTQTHTTVPLMCWMLRQHLKSMRWIEVSILFVWNWFELLYVFIKYTTVNVINKISIVVTFMAANDLDEETSANIFNNNNNHNSEF